jgi:hypothetical protein
MSPPPGRNCPHSAEGSRDNAAFSYYTHIRRGYERSGLCQLSQPLLIPRGAPASVAAVGLTTPPNCGWPIFSSYFAPNMLLIIIRIDVWTCGEGWQGPL